jgi:hypothetical protein
MKNSRGGEKRPDAQTFSCQHPFFLRFSDDYVSTIGWENISITAGAGGG